MLGESRQQLYAHDTGPGTEGGPRQHRAAPKSGEYDVAGRGASTFSTHFEAACTEESDIRADVLMHKQGIAYPPSQEPFSTRFGQIFHTFRVRSSHIEAKKQETMRAIYGEEACKSRRAGDRSLEGF